MNIRSFCHRGVNRIYTAAVQKLCEKEFVSSEGQSLRYLFFPCRSSDVLVVGFQACNDAGPQYNYVRTLQQCRVNRLLIKDDFGPGKLGVYYLGTQGSCAVERAVVELIDRYAAALGGQPRLVFIGSSKGGYAALDFGLQYPGSVMIAAAPQYHLAQYLDTPKFRATLEAILGGPATPQAKQMLDERLHGRILADRFAASQRVYLHYSDCEHTYPEHVRNLLAHLSAAGIALQTDVQHYTVHSDLRYFFPDYLRSVLNTLA